MKERLTWSNGAIHDGDTRYLILRADSLAGLFRRLAPAARAEALLAFAAAVEEAGGRSAARYLQDSGDLIALLQTIETRAAALGWGRWSFQREGDDVLELSVDDSPFASAYDAADAPVCAAITGMFTALAALVFGRPARVHETACVACGAARCRFHATPA